jgi:hypothetical protein
MGPPFCKGIMAEVHTRDVMISIVSLIYRSTVFADSVYRSVHKFTQEVLDGKAEFYFIANDPEERLTRHLENKGYRYYLNVNPRRTEAELEAMGFAWPEYIHRVYRGWNEGIKRANGEIVVLVNSDHLFSPDWLGNLVKHVSETTVVTSQSLEPEAWGGSFGGYRFGTIDSFNYDDFLKFVNIHRRPGEVREGGVYMPVAFLKSLAEKVGYYPEGNLNGGNFATIGRCGDAAFFDRLAEIGVKHITSLDSMVYHFQEGEMRAGE